MIARVSQLSNSPLPFPASFRTTIILNDEQALELIAVDNNLQS
jgi:hypothetical protein